MSTSPLPELRALESLLKEAGSLISSRVLTHISCDHVELPLYCLTMGNPDPELPALGLFGGVHGLERIGTHIILNFIKSLIHRLQWEPALREQLANMRLVMMPIVNPGGMLRSTRCNPNGVDLMRNAPIEAQHNSPWLIGGHRYSRHLPWYRGRPDQAMEVENQWLCHVVEEELFPHRFSLALDCHSGFGLRDRIWFPYARSIQPISHLSEVIALEELFEQSHPHHTYLVEPQSQQYCTHGDIWDYLYEQVEARKDRTFLPLTLEMGSWIWVKKNPRQLFSRLGMFNPVAPHRTYRALRRHQVWLDFLLRATTHYQTWQSHGPARLRQQERAVARWFGTPKKWE